jgi:hypothetical protein
MEARQVLRFQLEGSFNLLRERIQAVSDQEWDARAIPGASKIGFILWHCVRTIDWAVNRGLQGRPEVAEEAGWRERLHTAEGLFGAGIPDATADSLPGRAGRRAVLGYLDAVQPAALAWLDGPGGAELEQVPDFRAHLASRPEYLAPAVWEEIGDFVGAPAWHYLARPAISHIRIHVGEVDTLLAALRAAAV